LWLRRVLTKRISAGHAKKQEKTGAARPQGHIDSLVHDDIRKYIVGCGSGFFSRVDQARYKVKSGPQVTDRFGIAPGLNSKL